MVNASAAQEFRALGITYAAVAKTLDMNEASVKRMSSRKEVVPSPQQPANPRQPRQLFIAFSDRSNGSS